jgi:NAD(P)-dependent dehydrogenase (short-subunit alcohol dehydrogenase family)
VFAAAGAVVAMSGLEQETVQTIAGGIGKAVAKAILLACDATNDANPEKLVTMTLDAFGNINVLVRSDRGGRPKPLDMPTKVFTYIPIHKWPICPISALRQKFFAGLDLDQICLFLDGH